MTDLSHYSEKQICLDARGYPQSVNNKPNGLWLSVDDAWQRWCDENDFGGKKLSQRATVIVDVKAQRLGRMI